jgi:hypothetical protein
VNKVEYQLVSDDENNGKCFRHLFPINIGDYIMVLGVFYEVIDKVTHIENNTSKDDDLIQLKVREGVKPDFYNYHS